MSKRQCHGETKAGKPCRNTAVLEDGYCVAHTPNTADSRRFEGGPKPGAGRPRTPRVIEAMRQRVEADIERILKPYFDALDEAVLTATYEGAVIPSDVADLGARLTAAEKLLDRVYGKPRQSVEHSGPDSAPLAAELQLSSEAREALASVLRGRPASRGE